MGASYTGVNAGYTTVVGLRRGDLLDDEPLDKHTIVLDDMDDVVLIDGSLDELENVARAIRRGVDVIRAGLGDEATAAIGEPPTEDPGSRPAADLPPTLDYIAINPDGGLRLVSAILTAGDTLAALETAVGGRIQFEPGNDEIGIDCYANEDGRQRGLPLNQIAGLVHQQLTGFRCPLVLPGTIAFVGTDGEGATSLTPAQRHRVLDAWTIASRDLR